MPRSKGRSAPSRQSYSTGPRRSSASSSRTPGPPQPQQPGLFKQMAATAGGVAAGTVLGNALSGGGHHQQEPANAEQNQSNDPCATELRNFLTCVQNSSDISTCDSFNTVLKECRRYFLQRSPENKDEHSTSK